MRTNGDQVNRILMTAVMLVCIMAPVSAIAVEPSVNEQLP
jgi:hypothetical protein